jgi:hypothetical protein
MFPGSVGAAGDSGMISDSTYIAAHKTRHLCFLAVYCETRWRENIFSVPVCALVAVTRLTGQIEVIAKNVAVKRRSATENYTHLEANSD